MRKPILAGNWKMYKNTQEAKALVEGLASRVGKLSDREVVVCPPFTSLAIAAESMKGSNLKLGAQNMYWEDKGAFTGEIAPGMLRDTGCTYVIIGHSERRQYFGETDATVNKKMKKAFLSGLLPIVCIGETLAERESSETFTVLERQIREGASGLSAEEARKLVVAYEPVWAIGTGKTATPQQAEEAHKFIRQKLAEIYAPAVAEEIRILYGGSVKPENSKELMGQADIDGALVGGASLEPESFSKIVTFDL
ncbi:MAG: triose-phosphate isomerase [bacterium]|nr:triose-phosphate isomerase [bacterium]MDD5353946.1 triose-phosphate isomerase [bacterium]MDD5756319.1 triose-phosphate isomerase [bacterium]